MKHSHILLAGSLAVCSTGSFAYAQTISAGVNGTVTDASGRCNPEREGHSNQRCHQRIVLNRDHPGRRLRHP